jgi:ABC-type Co2+ transport system permease subunit
VDFTYAAGQIVRTNCVVYVAHETSTTLCSKDSTKLCCLFFVTYILLKLKALLHTLQCGCRLSLCVAIRVSYWACSIGMSILTGLCDYCYNGQRDILIRCVYTLCGYTEGVASVTITTLIFTVHFEICTADALKASCCGYLPV